jgi:xanthine dehydrogenase large subunit
VKYGIGFAYYNAGCQIGIYRSDGTITVSHNGVEIGQGINTKVAQTIAYELGVDLSLIKVSATSTARVANGGYVCSSLLILSVPLLCL